MLPSEVRDRATVYDIMVTEAVAVWEQKISEEIRTGVPSAPELTQEEMQKMMERVRGA